MLDNCYCCTSPVVASGRFGLSFNFMHHHHGLFSRKSKVSSLVNFSSGRKQSEVSVFAENCFENCFSFKYRAAKKSRGTEETSGKYYKTPFRLHLLLEESFDSLKVNLITEDGFEKDDFRPVVRLCSFRDTLIISD